MVSIVIPIYNAEKYLVQCIESIINQTYKDLEIICVDDGSTDSSADIVKDFIKDDNRIKLIQQKNLYAGVARNRGMDAAHGEYIMFLDADDFIEPLTLEYMVKKAEATKADIVICQVNEYSELSGEIRLHESSVKLNYIPSREVFSGRDIPDRILLITPGWIWDKLYRRDFLKGENIRFQNTKVANDEAFGDIAYAVAQRITVVKKPLINHRTHVLSSLESNRHKHSFDVIRALCEVKRGLEERTLFPIFRNGFTDRARRYLFWYLVTFENYDMYHVFYMKIKDIVIEQLGLLSDADHAATEEAVFFYNEIKYVSEETAKGYLYHLAEQGIEFSLDRWRYAGKWKFKENTLPKGSRVLIWGYGEVGRSFAEQITISQYLILVGIVDKNFQKFSGKEMILSTDRIDEFEFDYLLVAVNNADIAKEIQTELIKKNMSSDKIIWRV